MKLKASKVEYSKAMLPRTRKVQFLDCFKMNYALLLKCGLLLFLFALPLISFCLFMDFYYVSILEHATEAIKQTKLVFSFIFNIGVLLLLSLVVVALSGILHILRNFIWQEGIFFHIDFWAGVKENAGKNLLFYLICAILYLISFFIYRVFRVSIISLTPLLMFALIVFPIFLWILFINNTYKSSFGSLLRNGTFFYVKSIGWSLLTSVVCLLPAALLFMPFYLLWVKYIITVLLFIFVLPIVLLTLTLYSTSKFDDFINKENYPDHYLKGLNHD